MGKKIRRRRRMSLRLRVLAILVSLSAVVGIVAASAGYKYAHTVSPTVNASYLSPQKSPPVRASPFTAVTPVPSVQNGQLFVSAYRNDAEAAARAAAEGRPGLTAPAAIDPGNPLSFLSSGVWNCITDGLTYCITSSVFTLVSDAVEPLTVQIVDVMSAGSSWQITEGWVAQYTLGLGIAFCVLVIIVMRLFFLMARKPENAHEIKESFAHYLPYALLMWVAAPAIGLAIQSAVDALTTGIVSAERNNFSGITSGLPELIAKLRPDPIGLGAFSGVFIVLILGVIMMIILVIVLLQIMVQLALVSIALWMTGTVMGIAFAMMVDPTLRQRAQKLPWLWVSALLGKPLLFFLLGSMGALINAQVDAVSSSNVYNLDQVSGTSAARVLAALIVSVTGLVVVAIAPFKLLKFAPIIPGGGQEIGAAGAAVLGGIAINQAMSAAGTYNDAQTKAAAAGAGTGTAATGTGAGVSGAAAGAASPAALGAVEALGGPLGVGLIAANAAMSAARGMADAATSISGSE